MAGTSSDGQLASGLFTTVLSQAQGNGGNLTINTDNLSLGDRAQISASTSSVGNAGKVVINATNNIALDNESTISSNVEQGAVGNGGQIEIDTNTLDLTNGGQVLTIIREARNNLPAGQGNAGKIAINVNDSLTLNGRSEKSQFPSAIYSYLSTGAEGKAGNLEINTGNLIVQNSGEISSSTFGQGNSGNISITADNSISLDADSTIVNNVEDLNAVGDAGKINITTGSLAAKNGSQINSFSRGRGDAGDITIQATDLVTFDGISGSLTNVGAGSVGNGGNIDITVGSLSLTNNSLISTGVLGQGNAGGITITTGFLSLTNVGAIDSSTLGQGDAGKIEINANSLNLDDYAFISSLSSTTFKAGDITLNVADSIQATDSFISTRSTQSSGGNLTISAGDIKLRGNSDITTDIVSGVGSGGNINITADSIVAFDDSDIFASAPEGKGGNITLNTPAYFGENFTFNSLTTENTDTLQNNSRADINATGAVSSGAVDIPDVSFIQNSLTELENNSINTDELVANSCVVPVGDRSQGKFIITGTESLPLSPGDGIPSKYPTGEVRSVPEQSSWQSGDPIIEPQGAYRLANGKLVLSRQCSQ